jgi:hypothetical protein
MIKILPDELSARRYFRRAILSYVEMPTAYRFNALALSVYRQPNELRAKKLVTA